MRIRTAWLFLLLLIGTVRAAEITAFPLKNDGEAAIFIKGDLELGDRELFLTKIAPFKSGFVVFDSKGGNAYAGIGIGRAIRMRNFKTWVPSGSFCASACATAWLGGTRRLMGKSALIGFHSVYKWKDGEPVEAGMGNAMYGAYLAQLGLSEQAIIYLSKSAPTSMSWLTPLEAGRLGISLDVFDPGPSPLAPLSKENGPHDLESQSKDFVIALNVILSGPTDRYLKVLNGIYSEQVIYFGKMLPREDVVRQLTKFIARWPLRTYAARPDSIKVFCNEQTRECHVDGILDFDAKSIERNQHSHGEARFDYLLSYRGGSRWPVIVSEGGSVIDRKLEALDRNPEALAPPQSRYPVDLGAVR